VLFRCSLLTTIDLHSSYEGVPKAVYITLTGLYLFVCGFLLPAIFLVLLDWLVTAADTAAKAALLRLSNGPLSGFGYSSRPSGLPVFLFIGAIVVEESECSAAAAAAAAVIAAAAADDACSPQRMELSGTFNSPR